MSYSTPQNSFYSFLAMAFVSLLLIANVLGPKLITIGPLILPVSIFIFPLTYVIAVAITEVYGYRATKRVIWFAFLMNLVMALSFQVAICLPPFESWPHQSAYAVVLGFSSRIVAASLVSYFVSEFLNAYLVAKLKVRQAGKHFGLRAIMSIAISEAIGTLLVITLAFAGTISLQTWATLLLGYYLFKICYVICIVPILGRIVQRIKAHEQVDVFDLSVNFNPFSKA